MEVVRIAVAAAELERLAVTGRRTIEETRQRRPTDAQREGQLTRVWSRDIFSDEYKNMNSYKNSGSGSFGSQALYCQHIGHTFGHFGTHLLRPIGVGRRHLSHFVLNNCRAPIQIGSHTQQPICQLSLLNHKYSPTLNIIIKYFEHFLFDWN